jgi:hypothetical protein
VLTWFRELDRILRGDATRLSALREGRVETPTGGLLLLIVFLGAFYGACMGGYAIFNREVPEWRQVLASALKVPALFLLTLLVTYPSLYVFNALVGSRLRLAGLFRLLVAALAVTLAVLASFGPIVAFFSLTTSSYSFMSLFNVLLMAVAGFLGMLFLFRTLHRLTVAAEPPEVLPPEAPVPQQPAGALDRLEQPAGRRVVTVFACWVVLFAIVGAQMSWVLRPFIGDPEQPFSWFRPRSSHFFEAVLRALHRLLS